MTDVEGAALPRHARRLLRAQLRPSPPRSDRGGAGAARPGHAHLPRVPQRLVRAVLPRARRALRQGHGAHDEHRRRGRRDRDQDGAPVGLRRQGRGAGPREDRRGRRQLPRPDRHDRRLLRRPVGAQAGFGPFTPGFVSVPYGDADALAAAIDERHRGVPRRADPGRGRGRRAARGVPARRARALHRAQRPADGRRDPVRPRTHRHDVRVRARGRRARRLHPGQGARRRDRAALGGRRRCATSSASSAPASTARTFGGNPLACAIGIEVLDMLRDGRVPARVRRARARG